MLAIEQILLDQFDNDSIFKLELVKKLSDDDDNSIIEHKKNPSNRRIPQ